MQSLRWGILGTAKINSKIVAALKGHQRILIEAIGSRTISKARAFALEHQIPQHFEGYNDVITCDAVDAVYISLPNSEHFTWARQALLAGKHVLCEKPIALSATEVRELANIASQKSVVLMEGFMYRHHSQTVAIKEIVESGCLGVVQTAHCAFHFTLDQPDNIRMRADLGGGALNDIGCYCVDILNLVFAAVPETVSANALYTNGVDRRFHGLLRYAPGRTGLFDCSFDGVRRDQLEIVGSLATLKVPHPFKPGTLEHLILTSPERREVIEVRDATNLYLRQFENFCDILERKSPPTVSIQSSIDTATTLDFLRRSRNHESQN